MTAWGLLRLYRFLKKAVSAEPLPDGLEFDDHVCFSLEQTPWLLLLRDDFVAEVGWDRVGRCRWLFQNVAASRLAAAPHGCGSLRTDATDATHTTQRTLPFCPADARSAWRGGAGFGRLPLA